MNQFANSTTQFDYRIAILGGGNIGLALAQGLVFSGHFPARQITITRRQIRFLDEFKQKGFVVQSGNADAVKKSKYIIIAVRPRQLHNLLQEIKPVLVAKHHVVISLVTGISIQQLSEELGTEIRIARAMPNIAVSIGESMTCISTANKAEDVRDSVHNLFRFVGKTVEIEEEYMTPATALCACGVAFFLRSIRAASQGGIEIGFHGSEALLMAAQTAKGAAGLLLHSGNHPEAEIDKVTTPRGCTISGLNEMEHHGFSSAMIKGIIVSAAKAAKLLNNNGD
jgi:pyrroline-5-carboxylate reductase